MSDEEFGVEVLHGTGYIELTEDSPTPPPSVETLGGGTIDDNQEAVETLQFRYEKFKSVGWDKQAEEIKERLEVLGVGIEETDSSTETVDVVETLEANGIDPQEGDLEAELSDAKDRKKRSESVGWDGVAEREQRKIEALQAAMKGRATVEVPAKDTTL